MSRLLIIEDDGDLVQMLSISLFNAGYEVNYAFNGKEGYDKILSQHPDLVVMDLRMPVMSGTDVLKRLSENVMTRDIPVIVMTAYGDKEGILESSIKAQGAREFLTKPFRMKDLMSMIRRLLSAGGKAPQRDGRQIAKGVVRLDMDYRTVFIDDKRVASLPPRRAEILKLLLQSKGPVKRKKLIDAVWGKKGTNNILEKTIQRLRRDLGTGEAMRLQTRPEGYELIG